MNKYTPIVLGIAVLLVSCMSYQPLTYPLIGSPCGYTDAQLDENVFYVHFVGGSSRERAQDFALLRAAELTLTHGYTYFVIIDWESSTYKSPRYSKTIGRIRTYKNSEYGQGFTQDYVGQDYGCKIYSGKDYLGKDYLGQPFLGPTYRSGSRGVHLVIMCFTEKDENVYATFLNADYVSRTIKTNYGVY